MRTSIYREFTKYLMPDLRLSLVFTLLHLILIKTLLVRNTE